MNELFIDSIEFYEQNEHHNGKMVINWSSPNIGFGEYQVYIDKRGQLVGDSEYMDSGDSKKFAAKIFEMLLNNMIIIA